MTRVALAVFIVENEPAARSNAAAIVGSLGFDCETFPSGEQFFDAVDPSRPGCVIVDLHLEGMDAFELQQRLVDSGSKLPLIFMGAHVTVKDAARAMRAGAVSVLEKPYSVDELAEAICDATAINRNAHAVHLRLDALHARFAELNPRERDVMTLVVTGMPNKTIACELGVCQRTAAQIRADVFEKMGADSAIDLAVMASDLWRFGCKGTTTHANVFGQLDIPIVDVEPNLR